MPAAAPSGALPRKRASASSLAYKESRKQQKYGGGSGGGDYSASTASYGSAPSRNNGGAAPPSAKRFRHDEFKDEVFDETYEDMIPSNSSKAATAPSAKGGKQIVSSLFSANDQLGIDELASSGGGTSLLAPTNAPLTGSSSSATFPGLGLDPLLVHHLASKLSITHPTNIQRAALPSMLHPREDRDVFIQSQTGSGKTLTYLLPIIQSLLPLSVSFVAMVKVAYHSVDTDTHKYLLLQGLSYIDRSIGTLAIILVPTRELAKQISDVLGSLLSLNLSLPSETADDAPVRRTRWIVPGLLTGGSTRAHEKARIRKGLPILVSTPGRLLDHLQNTASFDVGKCRWLVLDEADRLMDLGFEETVTGILKGLDGRRKLALEALRAGESTGGVGGWDWSIERKTVLCSATVREDVQKLAGQALKRPVVFRASDVAPVAGGASEAGPKLVPMVKTKPLNASAGTDLADVVAEGEAEEEKFTPPSQLAQRHIVVPPKLRLVTLVSLLRSLLSNKGASASANPKEARKIIVFLSTTDSVDFHWKMLGGVGMGGSRDDGEAEEAEAEEEEEMGEEGEGEDDAPLSDSDDEDIRNMIKQAKAETADSDEEKETPAEGGKSKPKKVKPKSAAQKAAQVIKDEPVSYTSTLLPNTTLHRLHGSLPLQTRLASLKAFASTKPNADPAKPPASSILFCTSVASRGLDLPTVRAVVQYDLPTEGGPTEYVHRVGRTARVGRGGEAWSFVGTGPEKDWVPWIEAKMGEGVRLQPFGVEGVLKKGFGGQDWESRATEVQGAFERWVLSKTKNVTLAQKAFQSYVRSYSTHPLEEKRFFHIQNLHLGHLAKAFALRDAPSAIPSASRSKAAASAPRPAGSKWERDDDEGKLDAEKRMQEAVRKQGRMTKKGGVLGVQGTDDFQTMGTSDLEKLVSGYGKGLGGGGGGGKRKRK